MHDHRSPDGAFSQWAAAASDRELLAKFVRRSDERAFAEIVRRHGTLVLGVCRRVLRDRHSAEDAFQATFLVLARSASRIRRQRSLASWLHSVAYRIARRALAENHRRREQAVPMESVTTDDELLDVAALYEQQLLDEELQDLPDKYREPLVLHHLQGLTQQQVAERLGMSVSAVDGRLKRARKQLKLRLLRRGVEFGAVLAAVSLCHSTVQAASLEPLIALATQAAAAAHAGAAPPSTVSSQAARLAGKELTLMTGSSKLVATLAVSAVVVTLIGLAAGNVGPVEGAPAHGTLPLLSTAESLTTERTADELLLAQADRNSTVQPADDTSGTRSANLQEEINRISRDVADLAASVRANSAAVNNQKLELQNSIDGLQKAIDSLNRVVTTLQEQSAASPGESGPGENADESPSRLPLRSPAGDYTKHSPSEQRIEEALNSETSIEFPSNPLRDVIDYISQVHNIPIVLDEQTLLDAGISPDEEVSLVVSGIELRSALHLMLENVSGVPLDYVVQDEVMMITTREKSDRMLETRVYNLRDLPENAGQLVQSSVEVWMLRDRHAAVSTIKPGTDAAVLDLDADPRFQTSIQALPDALVVTQSQRIHREIVDLLEQLHRQSPKSMTSAIITAAINEELDQPVELEFRDKSLHEVAQFLSDEYGINFVLDELTLKNAGNSGSDEISIFLSGVTLRSALKIVLSQVGLTFLVEDEVIKITTPEEAARRNHSVSPSMADPQPDPFFNPRSSVPRATTGSVTSDATGNLSEDVSITGVIRVRGTLPALPLLVVAGDPRFKDSSILEADIPDQSMIAGDNQGLANVYVWLRKVPVGVPIPAAPSKPLVLASSGLRYVPHAMIARTEQPLRLTNADPVAVNVHISPLQNTPLNQAIAARDLDGARFQFERPERQPVRMVDDIHPTRVGYILPLDHPFVDLTDESGRFNIRQLPPGEYELTIWHERAGYLERNLRVTVPEDGAAELDLEIDAARLVDR